MTFQIFDPHAALKSVEERDPKQGVDLGTKYAAVDISTLRSDNAHWFSQPTGMLEMLATVWLINREFTRRGIAPA